MFFFLTLKTLNGYSALSENVRLENLSERIEDAARNERNGLHMISMGFTLAALGMVADVLVQNLAATVVGVFSLVLGTVSTLFGFYATVHYSHQYNKLIEEASTIER